MTLLDLIREYDFYTGEPTRERVSVSEIASGDILQMVLKRINKIPKAKKLTQATLGSIFDLGVKSLILKLNEQFKENFAAGERIEKELPNGVVLAGEPDILHSTPKEIYDAKLTKIYAMEQCVTHTDHQYRLQLNLYDYLLGGGHDLYLLWGLKDQFEGMSRGKVCDYHDALIEQSVARINEGSMIQLAVMKSSEMQRVIDGQAPLPEKCDDTWRDDVRCKYYCECRDFCDYYKLVGKDEPF